MEVLIKILQFIASLSLLVLIHEFGHFITARMFGVRVEKFYIFFNPWFSLVKFKIGETEFGIGWIPFGGYCKISGMIDESMDTEQMKEPPKPYEFRSKPAWQRLLIMTGGVIMNVLLAVIIYIGICWKWGDAYIANDDIKYGYVFSGVAHEVGFRDGDKILMIGDQDVTGEDYTNVYRNMILKQQPVTILREGRREIVNIPDADMEKVLNEPGFMTPLQPFIVEDVMPDGGAFAGGLLPGDSVVAVNGNSHRTYPEIASALMTAAGLNADITVARDSAGVKVLRTLPVKVSDEGKIGVGIWTFPVQYKGYNFLQSIPAGIRRTGAEISSYWDQLKMIFKPSTGAYKSLGGFMTIGSIFPTEWDWFRFWNITAFLSVILAIMNILPIPALDGGHVLFLLWEVVTGRKPSDKFMEWATTVGLLLLLALILYANANDIYRFFIK